MKSPSVKGLSLIRPLARCRCSRCRELKAAGEVMVVVLTDQWVTEIECLAYAPHRQAGAVDGVRRQESPRPHPLADILWLDRLLCKRVLGLIQRAIPRAQGIVPLRLGEGTPPEVRGTSPSGLTVAPEKQAAALSADTRSRRKASLCDEPEASPRLKGPAHPSPRKPGHGSCSDV